MFLVIKDTEAGDINWNEIPKDVEVNVLALKEDTNKVQGLIGIKKDEDAHAAYLR